MADLMFQCPYCRQDIEAGGEMAGRMINCPACDGLLRIPGGSPVSDLVLNFDCPLCGQNLETPEDAQGRRLMCPACRKVLTIPAPTEADVSPEIDEEQKKGSTARIEMPENQADPSPETYRIKIKRPGDPDAHPGGFFHRRSGR